MGHEVEDGGVTPLYWDLGRGMSMIFATDLRGYYSERWVRNGATGTISS